MKLVRFSILAYFIAQFAIHCAVPIQLANKFELNPTSYSFEFSREAVAHAIKQTFSGKNRYRSMTLEYADKPVILSTKAQEIFSAHKNDFYLHKDGDIIGKSKIYFGEKGQPLDYTAAFHIHLVDVNETKTKVEIHTMNPQVVIGEHFLPSFPHFGSNPKYKNVSRSTIEEYEILLQIGHELGVKDKMPVLLEPVPK
jgi:hypothetical protein